MKDSWGFRSEDLSEAWGFSVLGFLRTSFVIRPFSCRPST